MCENRIAICLPRLPKFQLIDAVPIGHRFACPPTKPVINVKKIKHQKTRFALSPSDIVSLPSSSNCTNFRLCPPIDITTRQRFGRSLLALYFQKHRYISPMTTSKRNQFLSLLFTKKETII